MIYLYAITQRPQRALSVEGLEGAAVRTLNVGPLCAVYSEHDQLTLNTEAECLWAHENVVEATMQQGPVLPARFGSRFADVRELEADIVRNLEALNTQLAAVRGCVEIALRVEGEHRAKAAEKPVDGRSYLLGQHDDLLQTRLAPLQQRAVKTRLAPSLTRTGTVKVSYLIPASEVAGFTEEVTALQRENEDLRLSATGPWPPYSFATAEVA